MTAIFHTNDIDTLATIEVDTALDDELTLRVCRAIGRQSKQIAIAKAMCRIAGNALARLADHSEAEAFHRSRAAIHRNRAAKSIPIARRAR